jgi:hypothetical protein
MRGVADQHNPAFMPAIELQPFDGAAMDLFVRVDAAEILMNRRAESREALAQPPEPTGRWIVSALWLVDIAEEIGVPIADRVQTEKAPVTHPELYFGRVLGPYRRQRPPRHLSGIDWGSRA